MGLAKRKNANRKNFTKMTHFVKTHFVNKQAFRKTYIANLKLAVKINAFYITSPPGNQMKIVKLYEAYQRGYGEGQGHSAPTFSS